MGPADPVLARLGLDLALDPSRLIVVGTLAAGRVVPVFTVAPFLGGRLVPAPIRVATSLALVALVFPFVNAATPDPRALGPVTLAALLLKEVAIGAVLGYLAALPFLAAEAAGRLADTARGANLAEVLVPQTGAGTSPLGDLAFQLAIVLFLAVDGHLLFLRALAYSYEVLPLASFPAATGLRAAGEVAISATAGMILAALGLAAPVLAALFLADLALGLLNRVAPQVPVYFVGMPAKALAGVIVFFLAIAAMALALRQGLGAALVDVERAIEALR